MTHEEAVKALRSGEVLLFSTDELREIANRLDRYRETIVNSKATMLLANHCTDGGRFDVSWIEEALK